MLEPSLLACFLETSFSKIAELSRPATKLHILTMNGMIIALSALVSYIALMLHETRS